MAPADVHIIATGKDPVIYETATKVAEELVASGVRVLYDDRPAKTSMGIKAKDAELIGVPTILIIGKGLAEGTVEIRDRRSGDTEAVAAGDAVKRLLEVVRP